MCYGIFTNKKGSDKQNPILLLKRYSQNHFNSTIGKSQSEPLFLLSNMRRARVMKNSKQTSARAASAASAVLRDGRTSAKSKTAAGSALAQRASRKTK